MIDDYQFGRMTIEGKGYDKDLKIIEGRVVPNWWRRVGHSLDASDAADILSVRPQTLVVGKGQPGRMEVTDALRSSLKAANIELIDQPTLEAVLTFNRLLAAGKNVAGAFHLTC